MTQAGARDVAHVVGRGKLAPAHRGERLRAEQERDGCTRTRAVSNGRMLARAPYDLHDVSLHARLHPRAAHFGATMRDRIGFGQRTNINLIEPARVEAF